VEINETKIDWPEKIKKSGENLRWVHE